MEVIIHPPLEPGDREEFKKLVAKVHADLAAAYINSLPCSITQKCELTKRILEHSQTLVKSPDLQQHK